MHLNEKTLDAMKQIAVRLKEKLENGLIAEMGAALKENWELKKTLASKISDKKTEEYYKKAIDAGASGGKLLGAGGGGFLLFYCEKEKQGRLSQALKELKRFPLKFEPDGSRIIFMEE